MKIFCKKPTSDNSIKSIHRISGNPVSIERAAEHQKEVSNILGRSGDIQKTQYTKNLPEDIQKGAEDLSGQDLSDVRVHYNAAEPARIDAHAYAKGKDIYIAPDQEKHLPHEAWHVVQQKQRGIEEVQAKKKKKKEPSPSESEADSVSKKLRKKNKARQPSATKSKISVPKIKTKYGTFEFLSYKFTTHPGDNSKTLDTIIIFRPGVSVTTSKVGLLQITRYTCGGAPVAIDPNSRTKMSKGNKKNRGWAVDTSIDNVNPLFAAEGKQKNSKKKSSIHNDETYSDDKSVYLGKHAIKKDNKWSPAILVDGPSVHGDGKPPIDIKTGERKIKPITLEIETMAMGIDAGKYRYYSSVKWGWKVDANGNLKQIKPYEVNPKTKTSGISKPFKGAIEAWNKSRTRGTFKTRGKKGGTVPVFGNYDGQSYSSLNVGHIVTPVYKYVKNKYKGQKVGLPITKYANGVGLLKVEYYLKPVNAKNKPKKETGYIRVSDLEDVGNGKKVLQLPIP